VFRNKLDDARIAVKNNARLVAKGSNQEKRIDFDETFVPIATLEAIHILIVFASHISIKLFQLNLKF